MKDQRFWLIPCFLILSFGFIFFWSDIFRIRNPALASMDEKTDRYDEDGEGDNTHHHASPILINDPNSHQWHNFHDPNDKDWVIFHAYPERGYMIKAIKAGNWNDYSLKANLYILDPNTMDNRPIPDPNTIDPDTNTNYKQRVLNFLNLSGEKELHICSDDCQDANTPSNCLPHTGFYFLEFFHEPCGTHQMVSTLYKDTDDSFITDTTSLQDPNATYEIIITTSSLYDATGHIGGYTRHKISKYSIMNAQITVEKVDSGVQYNEYSWSRGEYYCLDLLPGEYRIQAKAPGFLDTQKIPVTVLEKSLYKINLYLSPGPSGTSTNSVGIPNFSGEKYRDETYDIVTLHSGMNLFSFPSKPLCSDPNCFLKDIYDFVRAYYLENNRPHEFNINIRHNDPNRQWQSCFIDTNRSFEGSCFNLDPHEAYLIFTDIRPYSQDPNRLMNSISFPIKSDPNDSDKEPYNLISGNNLLGFFKPSDTLNSFSLFEDPNLKNKLESLLLYDPQKGIFYSHYRFFGKPSGYNFQLVEDTGYCLFSKEGIFDWQP